MLDLKGEMIRNRYNQIPHLIQNIVREKVNIDKITSNNNIDKSLVEDARFLCIIKFLAFFRPAKQRSSEHTG